MDNLKCKKVSIIVPIYNTEMYLKKSIDSIINQTYQNIEVILINDGSTDNSGKICDDYGIKDKRVKVIHKKNSGLSAARNVGIRASTGECIQFVDSDDYLEPDMTEKLVMEFNDQVTYVICGYRALYKSYSESIVKNITCPIEGVYLKSDFMLNFGSLFNQQLINNVWNKLYSAEIILKNNLQFVEGLKFGEDLLFNIEYLKVCDGISIVKETLYNYINFNPNSLTASAKKDFFSNQQMLFAKVREFLQIYHYDTKNNQDFIEMSYTDSIVGCFGDLFHIHSKLTSKEKKAEIRKIVYDVCVKEKLPYFYRGNIQKRMIGCLVNNKSSLGIYYYFKLKSWLRKTAGKNSFALKIMLESKK